MATVGRGPERAGGAPVSAPLPPVTEAKNAAGVRPPMSPQREALLITSVAGSADNSRILQQTERRLQFGRHLADHGLNEHAVDSRVTGSTFAEVEASASTLLTQGMEADMAERAQREAAQPVVVSEEALVAQRMDRRDGFRTYLREHRPDLLEE